MRVLVVEDERDFADSLAEGLRREGYAVDVAYDGDDARVKTAVYPYDLVTLDLSLPGIDGRELCRMMRTQERRDGARPPRVLMLSARDGLDDRIGGLDDGADDYLVKPFEFGELAARIRALLRRNGSESSAELRVGDLVLDAARHTVTRGERPLELTAKEFALLRYLMAHPGEVLSEGHLYTHVWDENANPYSKTVRVTIGNLRRKLAQPGEPQPIETVIGAGYRLRG
jgi:DNA-binding response OmpR family regulator